MLAGADPGEVKWVNSLSPLLSFFFLTPQILIGSITLLQKFIPHFKILDPRLACAVYFVIYEGSFPFEILKSLNNNVILRNVLHSMKDSKGLM